MFSVCLRIDSYISIILSKYSWFHSVPDVAADLLRCIIKLNKMGTIIITLFHAFVILKKFNFHCVLICVLNKKQHLNNVNF